MTVLNVALLIILLPLACFHFAAAILFWRAGQCGRLAGALAFLAIESVGIAENVLALVIRR